MGYAFVLALVSSILYDVDTMKLILTTIANAKVAIVESSEPANEKKGERYISEDCLKVNVASGEFYDISDRGWNPEGRLFMMRGEEEELQIS